LNKPTIEKGISEIVGVFTDPILVFPGGWGDTLPDWLKNAITLERLAMNMKALKGEEMTGTDAEACAYLYTASLTQPMDRDWTEIYLYIAGKVYEKWRTKESGVTMPPDIRVDSISDYQMSDLNRLKEWLYKKRTEVRLDRERAERRQKREEEVAERKATQPALFDF
jgi:phosphoglycerate-specific signal transduction histidine kinase